MKKTFKDFLEEKNISQEEFSKKSPAEMAELHNEFSQIRAKEVDEAIAKAATKEEMKQLIKENKEAQEESIKDLKEIIKNQGQTINSLKKKNPVEKVKSFAETVKDALTEKFEDIKEFIGSSRKGGFMEIEIKAPGVIVGGNVTTTGTAPSNYGATQVNGVSDLPRHIPFIEEFLTVGNTDLPSLPFVDEVPGEGDAEFITEGSLRPLIDADFVTKYSAAKIVGGAMKATRESISDFKWLLSKINGTLRSKHDIARQNGILNGDGNGANLEGIVTLAPSFNPAILGDLANSMANPNKYDVLATIVASIEADSLGNFRPNLILMNTIDALAMKLTKDGQGRYLLPPFISQDGKMIENVRIVTQPFISQGEFIVGDFTKINLENMEGYTVRIGYENDDFRKNQVTMVGESRLHLYVTTNDKRAFVKGSFANVITALKTA